MSEVADATNETVKAVSIPALLEELGIPGFDYLKAGFLGDFAACPTDLVQVAC